MSKFIGVKMIEAVSMTAREANDKGYRIGNHSFEEDGYEVTYPDGYKSWTPKDVADAAYYPLSENNDGTKIGLYVILKAGSNRAGFIKFND